MTNYAGNVSLSGELSDSLGESASFSGTLGVALTAMFSDSDTGSAYERVNGSINVSYTYSGGSGTNTVPFDFTTPYFSIALGNFQLNETAPVEIEGIVHHVYAILCNSIACS